MPYTVDDYYNAIDEIASFGSAESWDNVGLLVGSPKTKVKAVLVSLDVTSETIAEARLLGANLIITHHPVIFPSIKRIDGNSPLHSLITANIAVISAHTNYDISKNGVNDALCELFGLRDTRPLQSNTLPDLARIGELDEPMTSNALAGFVKERLGSGCVKFTVGKLVSTVAVCGGSGGELLRDAINQNAQALITSEAKHHQLLEARHVGFTLIDAGHYATEVVSMMPLAKYLRGKLPRVDVTVSHSQDDPALYV